MNTGEVLRNAAYRLSRNGAWTQKGWTDADRGKLQEGNANCIVGAIYRELGWKSPLENGLEEMDTEEVLYLARHLNIKLEVAAMFKNTYWSPLTGWNNAKERTQEEVVAALIGASELYDKEHVNEEELVGV